MLDKLGYYIAIAFGVGKLKPYAGTWGSLAAWIMAILFLRENQTALISVAIATTLISFWAATCGEKKLGHDSKSIVIDEWAGMFVTLIFIPYSLTNYIIAFIIFRINDIIKIPPAAQFEKLPRGWGVTMDDVMAGIYANIITRLIIEGINYYNNYLG